MVDKPKPAAYGIFVSNSDGYIYYPSVINFLLEHLSTPEIEEFALYLNKLWNDFARKSDFGRFFLEYFIDSRPKSDEQVSDDIKNRVGLMLTRILKLPQLKGEALEKFQTLKNDFNAYCDNIDSSRAQAYLNQVDYYGARNIFLVSYVLKFRNSRHAYRQVEESIMEGFDIFSSDQNYLNECLESSLEESSLSFFTDYAAPYVQASEGKDNNQANGNKPIPSVDIQKYKHIIAPRLLGMGLDAQQKSSEWEKHQHEGEIFPLAHANSDYRDTFRAVFFMGGAAAEAQAIDLDTSASPYNKSAAEKILQRWGIAHARLYVGITVALTKTRGNIAEIDEAELFKIAGLSSDISNGNLKKSEARQEIKEVLDDLKSLCVYLVSSDEKYSTGRFPIYIVEPLVVYEKSSNTPISIRARVAPGLWARDVFEFDKSPILPFSAKILDIPSRRNPLAATFSLWLSLNMYRFAGKNRMSVGKVLRAILPDVKPHKSWNGLDITWRMLHPIGAQQWETKNARISIRRQFTGMPKIFSIRGIKMELVDYKSTSTWEEFMDTEVCIESLGPKILSKPKSAKTDTETTAERMDKIRSRMAELGITQSDLAKQLGVTQPTVSNWLKTGKIPKEAKSKMDHILRENP